MKEDSDKERVLDEPEMDRVFREFLEQLRVKTNEFIRINQLGGKNISFTDRLKDTLFGAEMVFCDPNKNFAIKLEVELNLLEEKEKVEITRSLLDRNGKRH